MEARLASPPPIRTDETNAFAHRSMAVRVPKIIDDVRTAHPDYPPIIADAIAELRDAIAADSLLPPLAQPAPDASFWSDGLARRVGSTWLHADWFFVECYAYRCLLARTRYWETRCDPFAKAKDGEIASARPWGSIGRASQYRELPSRERLRAILGLGLWGNRIDLSYAVGTGFGAEGGARDLIVDDRDWAIDRLFEQRDLRNDIHILVDNSGSELLADLLIVDALLELTGKRITLHVKMAPTFVSDATVEDVWSLLSAMRGRDGESRELALRLQTAFDSGRLRIAPDFYWNSALFWDERPAHIAAELDRAALVVVKGDANYRRLLGDAIWPAGATLAQAVGTAAPILCLRALKSDAMVGLPEETILRLDSEDANWRINGRRGIIQANGGD
jgi:hypothetical protein